MLHEGPPVAGEPEWRLREDAAQYAAIRLPDGVKLLQLSEPWCADTATGAVGPVASAVPPQILKMLLAAPAIAPDAAALVRAQIAQRMPGVALPAPHIVPPPREVSGKLQPVLHLIEGTITVPGARMVFRGRHVFNEPSWTETIKLARLCYRYGPVTLAVNDERDTLVLDGERLKIPRNRKRETECTKLLQRTGMSSAGSMFNLPASAPHATDFAITDPSPDAWVDFMLNQIPKLRDQGLAGY